MEKPWNDVFLKACRKEETPYVPVFYRQRIGSSLPEYRQLLRDHSSVGMSEHPEICVEMTQWPVKRLGVDAAVLFADIMTPVRHLGIEVAQIPDMGPMVTHPLRTKADIDRLGELDPEAHLSPLLEAVRILNQQLTVPLIGLAGAPFTLASYLIEGKASKHHRKAKELMYVHSEEWQALMRRLSDMTQTYLQAQIEAGVQVVNLVDPWAGSLSSDDYRDYVAPTMHHLLEELNKFGVPIIYHGIGTDHLLNEWNQLPVDVIGLDWRTSILTARKKGITKGLLGNLDPALLLGPWELLEERTKQVLDQGMERKGFIFSLGDSIAPAVDEGALKRLTRLVHQYTTMPEVWG